VEATSRRALERRYRLLPYFYTLFEEASRVGTPVARPVFFTDPSDAALRQEDDAFLLGADLLVAPQHTPARDRVLTLPKPERGVAWRKFDFASFDGGRDSKDADLPELSLRPGSIVPSGPVIEHVRDRPNSQDELTLLICLDADGRAEGWLYEDAGDGFGYEQGDFLRTRYEAQRGADGVVTVRIAETRGERPRSDRVLVARVLEADGTERVATGMDGEELRVR
jgi:alpha-glucosidase